MKKRAILFGDYDTAANGWTLTPWTLDPAVQKTNFVDKPGGDGSWDLSTTLTDGLPRYNDRNLTVRLECSEGDRLSREAKIRDMVNRLHGTRTKIILPDEADHYLSGRLHVVREYNDLAHAAVTVTATCEPWKYAVEESFHEVAFGEYGSGIFDIVINGGRAVVPVLNVLGSEMRITFGAYSVSLSEGAQQWPEFLLSPGYNEFTCEGLGVLQITYREAVLE